MSLTKPLFNSLGAQYQHLSQSGQVVKDKHTMSELVAADFKGQVETYFKGRQALSAALLGLGIGPADCVAIPGFTCYAVESAVREIGAVPVFVDIDPETLNPSLEALEAVIEANPIRAVVYHYTLGIRGAYRDIAKLCRQQKILFIEDLAHLYPENSHDDVGRLGQATVLSFGRDKIWDAVTGGAASIKVGKLPKPTKAPASLEVLKAKIYPGLTRLIRKTHQHGLGKVLLKVAKATSMLSNPIDASSHLQTLPEDLQTVAVASYHQLPQHITHRASLTSIYSKHINPRFLLSLGNDSKALLRFPIRVANPQELAKQLEKHQIYLSDIWYRKPVETGSLAVVSSYKSGTCPISESVTQHIFNLPTHLGVSSNQAKTLARLVNEYA